MIQVGGSRQLFVDDFLIEDTADLRRVFHQATVSPTPVLSPSKPWESASANPAVRSGLVRSQAAFAFSGGIWHDPSAPPDRRYRLYYECGINNAVCLAVSADGVAFSKPKLRPDGSNIVVDLPHDGSSVHLVLDEPDPSKRWKMTIAPVQFCHNVTVNGVNFTGQPVIPYLCDNSGSGCSVSAGNGPGGGDCGCQHLKHSADGITWRTALNKTGSSGDRSTGFYNALRRKFVWSIRASNPSISRDEPDGGLSACSRDRAQVPAASQLARSPGGGGGATSRATRSRKRATGTTATTISARSRTCRTPPATRGRRSAPGQSSSALR